MLFLFYNTVDAQLMWSEEESIAVLQLYPNVLLDHISNSDQPQPPEELWVQLSKALYASEGFLKAPYEVFQRMSFCPTELVLVYCTCFTFIDVCLYVSLFVNLCISVRVCVSKCVCVFVYALGCFNKCNFSKESRSSSLFLHATHQIDRLNSHLTP